MLCLTGYLIGNPIVVGGYMEPAESFFFGTIRFLHFLFSFLFFFNYIMRTYWGFVGNKYSKWDQFIPYKKENWQEIWAVLKVDIFHLKHQNIESVGGWKLIEKEHLEDSSLPT